MKLKCYLFGHKEYEETDSGYPVCQRCGCHSYYDDWNDSAKLLRPFWFVSGKIKQFQRDLSYWWDCKFNGNKLPF